MAGKRRLKVDSGQGTLFGLVPQVKPLEDGAPAGRIRQSKTTARERATGERFVPPVNWIEDDDTAEDGGGDAGP